MHMKKVIFSSSMKKHTNNVSECLNLQLAVQLLIASRNRKDYAHSEKLGSLVFEYYLTEFLFAEVSQVIAGNKGHKI